jgi:hypothetical protein
VVGVVLGAVACSGDARGQAAFCNRLARDVDTLKAVGDAKSVDVAVANYRALDGLAPEAIHDQWHAVTQLVQQAATLDTSSAEARSALVQQAYAVQSAAQAVTTYAKTTCGVDFTAPATTPAPAANATTTPPTSG